LDELIGTGVVKPGERDAIADAVRKVVLDVLMGFMNTGSPWTQEVCPQGNLNFRMMSALLI